MATCICAYAASGRNGKNTMKSLYPLTAWVMLAVPPSLKYESAMASLALARYSLSGTVLLASVDLSTFFFLWRIWAEHSRLQTVASAHKRRRSGVRRKLHLTIQNWVLGAGVCGRPGTPVPLGPFQYNLNFGTGFAIFALPTSGYLLRRRMPGGGRAVSLGSSFFWTAARFLFALGRVQNFHRFVISKP